jgi:diguanylate cyclase (GGDEF)-like protein/PAS domain S-box-containing protein
MTEKPTLLVIDDEPQIVQAIIDQLEHDFHVISASSGAEGVCILTERSDIAVILCDQRMPKMTGDEFFKHARELSQASRVLITGYADLQAVVRAINDGQIHSYMSKPFDVDHLRLAVGAAYKGYQTAAALQAERDLMRGLMDSMPDHIYIKDRDCRLMRINRTMADWLGFESPEMAIGRREDYFVPADHAVEIAEAEKKILEEDAQLVHQVRVEAEGTADERWWSTITVPIRDESAKVTAMVAIRRDISEERRLERDLAHQQSRQAELEEINRKIQHAAGHDPLTGLANRILLEDRMQQLQAQSKRHGTSIALIYLDLDGFKTINDTLGHAVGDKVLKAAAELLMPCLRATDVAARLGGDEFVVLCTVDRARPHLGAKMVADRILQSIGGMSLPDPTLRMGCSIGIAVFPDDDKDFTGVMRLADRAMYEAKRGGKNAVVLSTELAPHVLATTGCGRGQDYGRGADCGTGQDYGGMAIGCASAIGEAE